MVQTAKFRRMGVAISLVLAASLSVVWIALEPVMAESPTDQLGAMADAGARATISAFAFVVSQLAFIIAVLGIAHLIADRSPILANIGGTIAVIGGFGHAVFGGAQLVQLGMAADEANHAVYAGLLGGGLPWPLMILMMAGTIGTVLGLLLLGIGLLRAKAGPRWVPYTLWAFLLVEFVGTNFTEWATLVSGLLYLASFVALAVAVWRSPVALWMSGTAVTTAGISAAPGTGSVAAGTSPAASA
ncbi:hypothetical protein [Glaciibacter superstes]|uniref:hypothetical protein n=1 Tax=Glaciibacter superstes TaxID=501023 RepID=UPI00040571B3|nr:hypothetical protein [Glaciibacter superstes]